MLGNLFGKKQSSTTDPGKKAVVSEQNEKKGLVGGLKDKAVEKMMQRQMKNLPTAQRDMLMKAVKNNPKFFETIASKIKEEEKRNGGNQMAASMKVMREHQGEMMKIMMQNK